MTHASNILKTMNFADDTNLRTHLCLQTRHNKCILGRLDTNSLNAELANIDLWVKLNGLSLNYSKTNFMIFHHSQRNVDLSRIPRLVMDGKALERIDYCKFLGIWFDKNMTWGKHVNEIAKKISSTCGILNILKNNMPKRTLK